MLHQLFPGKLLESARWPPEKSAFWWQLLQTPNANLVGEVLIWPALKGWFSSWPCLHLLSFPRYDFAFWFLKNLRLFFWFKPKLRPWRARHGRAPCGRDWDPWATTLMKKQSFLESQRMKSAGSKAKVIPRIWPRHGGNWEIGPKRVQVVEFFFGGMRVAGDHEIYGDLSDVPPQRLREDMGLVCLQVVFKVLWFVTDIFSSYSWWQVKAVIKSTRDLWRKGSSALSHCVIRRAANEWRWCLVFAGMVGFTRRSDDMFWRSLSRKEGSKQECKLAMSWSNFSTAKRFFWEKWVSCHHPLHWWYWCTVVIYHQYQSWARGVGGVSHLREWNLGTKYFQQTTCRFNHQKHWLTVCRFVFCDLHSEQIWSPWG